MVRLYHSPSSIELGARCRHAWALSYIAKLREPEITWAQIESGEVEYTSRQRAKALGGGTHAVLEDWYTPGGTPDWRSFPGQVALSGAHLLPHPSKCGAAWVERAIGSTPLPYVDDQHPTVAFEACGIKWVGYLDLVAYAPEELTRLGIHRAHQGWGLFDYKTTASIERYAKTSADLLRDLQANLYGLAIAVELDLPWTPGTWVYFESKKVRRAHAVPIRIEREHAYDVIAPCAELARELDTYERIEDAPKNPAACGEYGGCSYHVSAGGPCNARRSVGALIQARVRKEPSMALTPEQQAAFDTMKGGTSMLPPTPGPVPQGQAPTPSSAPAAPAPGPAPQGRKPRAQAAPAPAAPVEMPAPAAPVSNDIATIVALTEELKNAQAIVDHAVATRDGVRAQLRAACE